MIRKIRNWTIGIVLVGVICLAAVEVARVGFAIHRFVNWRLGERELVDDRIRAIVKPEACR